MHGCYKIWYELNSGTVYGSMQKRSYTLVKLCQVFFTTQNLNMLLGEHKIHRQHASVYEIFI